MPKKLLFNNTVAEGEGGNWIEKEFDSSGKFKEVEILFLNATTNPPELNSLLLTLKATFKDTVTDVFVTRGISGNFATIPTISVIPNQEYTIYFIRTASSRVGIIFKNNITGILLNMIEATNMKTYADCAGLTNAIFIKKKG